MEVDQTFIAAILTIIGYSINDTVVVFDRIRETIALYPKRDRYQAVSYTHLQLFDAGYDSPGNLLFDNHIRLTIIRILFVREGTQKKDTICIVSFFYRE